jgi:threonine/homoserine/homoserine lactone efflux protein
MGRALGDVLPLAVAIAIFPVPVIASVLLLGAGRGRARAAAFVLAWAAGLGAVGAVVVVLADEANASESSEPAVWVSALLLVLGVVVVAAAAGQWRGRPVGTDDAPTPGWMRTIDEFTVTKAAGAGFALSALNPKNVLLTVAAGFEIADVGLSPGATAVALVVFVAIASIGVLAPLALSIALGERARGPLDALRAWMARYSAVIMAVLLLVIGAKLVGDAIAGFSS